ncbi:hypothetical protein CBM2599_B50024 [Cupriavidus taiwanensis]|nr:hypothetical protein CBM2600_B10965 [Cupriavidus taiwanensis]SOY96003.1 hypothetical protein CBM2599_B50024 [Cupriavidus taiwanensis]
MRITLSDNMALCRLRRTVGHRPHDAPNVMSCTRRSCYPFLL